MWGLKVLIRRILINAIYYNNDTCCVYEEMWCVVWKYDMCWLCDWLISMRYLCFLPYCPYDWLTKLLLTLGFILFVMLCLVIVHVVREWGLGRCGSSLCSYVLLCWYHLDMSSWSSLCFEITYSNGFWFGCLLFKM